MRSVSGWAKEPALSRTRVFQVVRVVVSIALIVLILSTIDLRDRVELVDGTVLSGTIEHRDPEAVTIKLAGGLRQRVPMEEVAREPATGRPRAQEGLLTVLKGVDLRVVAVATTCFGVVYLLAAFRWKLLLHAQGILLGLGQLLRLVFVGLLFNNFMPGSMGGDVVKAYYVTRQTRKKVAAVLTILLDRMVGLTGLLTLCLFGTLVNIGQPEFGGMFIRLAAALGFVAAVAAVALSHRLRRLLHVEGIIQRLPFRKTIVELDRAVLIYRDRKAAVFFGLLLSISIHVLVVTVNIVLGRQLGMDARATHYFSLVPLALAASALPISLAGWGVGEWAYAVLFSSLDPANWTKGMALSVLFRLSTVVVWSLVGAVFLAVGGAPSRAELEHEVEQEEELLQEMTTGPATTEEGDGE